VAVQFRVRVVNAAGLGAVAVSSPVTPAAPLVVTPAPPVVAAPPAAAPLPVAATPVTRPGQVQSWKLTKPVPSKRLVTWKRPVVTANNAATAYRWRLSATNGRTWSTWFVVASKAVSTRLLVKVRPGTRYVLVLVPLNRAGSGKASAIKFRI
jgi:hypothetical protein